MDGDLLLFVQLCDLGTPPAAQTGFSRLAHGAFNGGLSDLSLWTKTAASESGNYTWNNGTGGSTSSVWALCLSGVDPASAAATAGASGTSTTSLTQFVSGVFLVSAHAIVSATDSITSNNGFIDLGALTNGTTRLQVSWGLVSPMSATIGASDAWLNFLAGMGAGAPPPSGGAGSQLPSGEADLTPRRFSVRVPTRRNGGRRKP